MGVPEAQRRVTTNKQRAGLRPLYRDSLASKDGSNAVLRIRRERREAASRNRHITHIRVLSLTSSDSGGRRFSWECAIPQSGGFRSRTHPSSSDSSHHGSESLLRYAVCQPPHPRPPHGPPPHIPVTPRHNPRLSELILQRRHE